MLVDATHQEETRIVVINDNQLEEFDFESASRLQLRGNIYLAKVTRVEPSLQACFVEYGGNRHGFLAFSEIHPDYYQIPVADREALLAAEREQVKESEDEEIEEETSESSFNTEDEINDILENEDLDISTDINDAETESEAEENENILDGIELEEDIEQITANDNLEVEEVEREKISLKRYKIQEVIKRRQVMLVQVVKEERGNKGAALTTYLSLAGRYSVLMPNTARGGGISRKITNIKDRKRLKEIASSLAVPEGMGVILRTAGASRTKAEIKRDFEYLMRLWENVRTLTLNSTAPCLVYEEGSLIKRTIRDLYSKEIDELLVAGEKAYAEAREFMRMIMPSHVKKVKLYKEEQPIFAKYKVESQLDSMFSPKVTLPSGGYIIINPTEALVSIDVNSGRATKERNIEATALQTNLEAAQEVARQLKLRDMAGLVVIDFIDMMDRRSIRSVENKLKEALKNDRARIQVGRISHFGLLEMSRQRMRFGVLESSTNICPTCKGAGIVRSVESLALMVVRAIEDYAQKNPNTSINVKVSADVANFILNVKREALSKLEAKNSISISVWADIEMSANNFIIEAGEKRQIANQISSHIKVDSAGSEDIGSEPEGRSDAHPTKKRRRRPNKKTQNKTAQIEAQQESNEEIKQDETEQSVEEAKKERKRGRRGGRRTRGAKNKNLSNETDENLSISVDSEIAQKEEAKEINKGERTGKKTKKNTKKASKKSAKSKSTEQVEDKEENSTEQKEEQKKKEPIGDEIIVTSSNSEENSEEQPKKVGWWQRRGFFG